MKNLAFIANGGREASRANQVQERQADAEAALRRSYRERIQAAGGFRRLTVWIAMKREIRRARKKVEDRLAPGGALYARRS